MQVLITHGGMARTRVLQFGAAAAGWRGLLVVAAADAASGAVYHFVFLKAARDGWPVVSQIVKLVVRDEIAQRDRFMRENLDAMAQKVGEMQAKLVKLEAMGDRVSGLAGVKPEELKPLRARARSAAARAGPSCRPRPAQSLEELQRAVSGLDEATDSTPTSSRWSSPAARGQARPDGAQRAAGRRPGGLGLRLPHRPLQRPRRAAHRAGLSGRPGHADHGRGRRHRAGPRVAPGLWPHGRDRPRQRPGDALRPLPEGAREAGRAGQARAEDRRGRQSPGARPGRTCTSRCWSTACRRTRRASWPPRPRPIAVATAKDEARGPLAHALTLHAVAPVPGPGSKALTGAAPAAAGSRVLNCPLCALRPGRDSARAWDALQRPAVPHRRPCRRLPSAAAAEWMPRPAPSARPAPTAACSPRS
jgi:hypothetical protein